MHDRWLPGGDPACDDPQVRPDHEVVRRLSGEVEDRPIPPLVGSLAASIDLLRAASASLRRLPFGVRAAALTRVARAWLDPIDPIRQEADSRLPAAWKLPVEEVNRGLEAAFSVVTAAALTQAWQRVGEPSLVGLVRPSAHLWPRTVPTAGLPPVFASILAGRPAVVKAPAEGATFAAFFARSVASLAPELGPVVAAAAWGRADLRATSTLLTNCDPIFVFGDADTLRAIRAASPTGTAVHGFGPRWSVGFVPKEEELDVPGILRDTFAWQGEGCLCPRWWFVEGEVRLGETLHEAFASRLNAAPPPTRQRSLAEASARQQWLGVARFLGSVTEGPGCVIARLPLDLSLGEPPPGVVAISSIPSEAALCSLLTTHADALQGLSVSGQDETVARLRSSLPRTLVASAGNLQRPPLDWIHDDVDALACCC